MTNHRAKIAAGIALFAFTVWTVWTFYRPAAPTVESQVAKGVALPHRSPDTPAPRNHEQRAAETQRNRFQNIPGIVDRLRLRRQDYQSELRLLEERIAKLQYPIDYPRGSDMGSFEARRDIAFSRVNQMKVLGQQKMNLQRLITDLGQQIEQYQREHEQLRQQFADAANAER